MYDRLSRHYMQGGLMPATATFRGVPADFLVSFCEARPDMWHKMGGYVFRWEEPPGESEADKLEREVFWIVLSKRARECVSALGSYDSIDSWDAASCGPDLKKFYMQRRAEREAVMEAKGEAGGGIGDAGLRAGVERYTMGCFVHVTVVRHRVGTKGKIDWGLAGLAAQNAEETADSSWPGAGSKWKYGACDFFAAMAVRLLRGLVMPSRGASIGAPTAAFYCS
eukprot:jgi/Tetstr1/440107/TSEL_028465.t1